MSSKQVTFTISEETKEMLMIPSCEVLNLVLTRVFILQILKVKKENVFCFFFLTFHSTLTCTRILSSRFVVHYLFSANLDSSPRHASMLYKLRSMSKEYALQSQKLIGKWKNSVMAKFCRNSTSVKNNKWSESIVALHRGS